jgi:hypothetical protein
VTWAGGPQNQWAQWQRWAKLRPIVRPGTPAWVPTLLNPRPRGEMLPWLLGAMAALLAYGGLAVALGVAGNVIGALIAMAAPMALLVAVAMRRRNDLVVGPGWQYEGTRLSDAALDLLEDIQGRFDYAHTLVDQVPTGIEWADIAGHIDVLMWECAGGAARASMLDAEIHDLRYAAAGTPQAAQRDALTAQRQQEWHALVVVQRDADSLAREAGNAAAAARTALARPGGSLEALAVAAPSAASVVARGAVAEARVRLSILAEVWAELDDSGELLAERLGLEENDPNA